MRRSRNAQLNEMARTWSGPYRSYDLVKEVVIATAVVAAIAIVMAILFSSPDEKPSTIQSWSRNMPVDFLTTATAELDGTSDLAEYGPPYNHNGEGQHIAFIHLQKWLGVSHPINTAYDYVIDPLRSIPGDPALTAALASYVAASKMQQQGWTGAYAKGLEKARQSNGAVSVPPGEYGPVAPMMASLLGLTQSGGVDGALLTSRQFYQTDYTKPLLFLADGGELERRAEAQHLLGTQWGMMNETGSYPGQVWLWLYTFWYQVEPFKASANADALVMLVMLVLSALFILIPFIPGVRDIPRAIPLYKLIWREHYREQREVAGAGTDTPDS
ncbi:MAG TPA: hypothetical protein VGP17_00260 [Solirubrobacteraceae bacterium]|nr:hypothetical protein [Solirubrobacteraceae bacterium]